MQRFVSLIWLIVSGLLLTALANSTPAPEHHIGERVSSWLLWGVMGIPGLLAGRIGLGLLLGESGAYLDHRVREIVFWRRNALLMRSAEHCPLDQFEAIHVQKWKQRGFPANLHGYAVTLSSSDRTRKVDWFQTKGEASETAKRLAACCHLAIQADDAGGIPAS